MKIIYETIKRCLGYAACLVVPVVAFQSCSPETEDCPRYSAGVITMGDQTLLKSMVSKDTLRFRMNDTILTFTKADSSNNSFLEIDNNLGPCGTEYTPERIMVKYKQDSVTQPLTITIEQRAAYPAGHGQVMDVRFYKGDYYYYTSSSSAQFSFAPEASIPVLTEFRIGNTVYQSVRVLYTTAGAYLFISQNGEILEIRSNGKVYTKAD